MPYARWSVFSTVRTETTSRSAISRFDAPAEVKARGYWEQVWIRFRRDRFAFVSIFVIVVLVVASFPGAYIAEKLLGHGPNQLFFDGVDERLVPVGPWTYVTDPQTGEKTLLVLGADGSLGRDEFLRLLYGGRVSLEVALLSVIGVMSIGVVVGAVAGYYRGTADTVNLRREELHLERLVEAASARPASRLRWRAAARPRRARARALSRSRRRRTRAL